MKIDPKEVMAVLVGAAAGAIVEYLILKKAGVR